VQLTEHQAAIVNEARQALRESESMPSGGDMACRLSEMEHWLAETITLVTDLTGGDQ
jgi:hypothetical protein